MAENQEGGAATVLVGVQPLCGAGFGEGAALLPVAAGLNAYQLIEMLRKRSERFSRSRAPQAPPDGADLVVRGHQAVDVALRPLHLVADGRLEAGQLPDVPFGREGSVAVQSGPRV